MRNSLKGVIIGAAMVTAAIGAAQQITVQVNGQPVHFTNTGPRYVNGRVLVPLRGVFEEMGAQVNWNPGDRMVTATRTGADVQLRIGDPNAWVNGTRMSMDVPAMIIGGSTMVPIRFVSEALGAQVGWMESARLVTIDTGISGTGGQDRNRNWDRNRDRNRDRDRDRITSQPARLRTVLVRENTVIPVTLDQTLNSRTAREGDRFTATVQDTRLGEYSDIPNGTKVEGRILAVTPMRNNDPALMELEFTRMRFPNGQTVPIEGSLIALDEKSVSRNDNGTLIARSDGGKDQRMVYAGYGAGAGLIVGLLTDKPLLGALLGGAAGYILGQVQRDQRKASDITLQPGTEMGVRMERDVTLRWNDR